MKELGLDDHGNPQYEFEINAEELGEALRNSPDTVVAVLHPLGPVRFTLGFNVPQKDLDDPNQGWVGGEIREYMRMELGMYLGVKAYYDESSITSLKSLAGRSRMTDKFFVQSAGNNGTDISKLTGGKLPEANNFALVAAWNNIKDEPYAGVEGPAGQVYFVDPFPRQTAGAATEIVAEWLVEQNTDPKKAKQILDQHSKDFKGKSRVVDFSPGPSIVNWNNPENYKKVE